jgi:dihydrofolate reductase
MSKLRLSMTMSLDGFVAGPNQSEKDPLGIGGMQLHQWMLRLKAFRETHGEEEGGEVNESTPIAEEILGNVGATIMGRNMFGGRPGPWGDDPWKGYWGGNPPYHHPVFVLTRHPREPLEMEGGTRFHFVTDGIESALEQARAAAGDKDVSIGGGANVVQQNLAAGLLDEMVIRRPRASRKRGTAVRQPGRCPAGARAGAGDRGAGRHPHQVRRCTTTQLASRRSPNGRRHEMRKSGQTAELRHGA